MDNHGQTLTSTQAGSNWFYWGGTISAIGEHTSLMASLDEVLSQFAEFVGLKIFVDFQPSEMEIAPANFSFSGLYLLQCTTNTVQHTTRTVWDVGFLSCSCIALVLSSKLSSFTLPLICRRTQRGGTWAAQQHSWCHSLSCNWIRPFHISHSRNGRL